MTLKQRRRQGELLAQLDKLGKDPYILVPKGYTFGEDPDEDEKYKTALESLKSLVEELHDLEDTARAGN